MNNYCIRRAATAELETRVERLRERVMRFSAKLGGAADAGLRGLVEGTRDQLRSARRELAGKLAHNARVEIKRRMLGDRGWRLRVLAELGGTKALARWERAWARYLARQDEGGARQQDAGASVLEAPVADVRTGVRRGVRTDGSGRFRFAPIPRGRRAAKRKVKTVADNPIAAKWSGRLARLAREAARRERAEQDEGSRRLPASERVWVTAAELRGEAVEAVGGVPQGWLELEAAGRELAEADAQELERLERAIREGGLPEIEIAEAEIPEAGAVAHAPALRAADEIEDKEADPVERRVPEVSWPEPRAWDAAATRRSFERSAGASACAREGFAPIAPDVRARFAQAVGIGVEDVEAWFDGAEVADAREEES